MADKQDAKKDEISEDELDQIIQDMSKDEPVEQPEKAEKAERPVLELVPGAKKKPAPTGGTGQQALTLEMNGVVNLKLSFKNGDRSIEVLCAEDFLTCRMADGTEFKIPTGVNKARKAA